MKNIQLTSLKTTLRLQLSIYIFIKKTPGLNKEWEFVYLEVTRVLKNQARPIPQETTHIKNSNDFVLP